MRARRSERWGDPEKAQELFEQFFMADGGFEYVINGTSFFHLEMTGLSYYPTRLSFHGLQLEPMWCFSAHDLGPAKQGQFFVNAVNGRVSWCFPEEPLDRLPHSQPFSGSAYYEGE